MKVRTYFFGCLLSVLMWQCAPKENEYVVIAGKGVAEDTAWMKVAEALQNKHRAALLSSSGRSGGIIAPITTDTSQICGYCRKTGDSGEGLCNGNASVEPESR